MTSISPEGLSVGLSRRLRALILQVSVLVLLAVVFWVVLPGWLCLSVVHAFEIRQVVADEVGTPGTVTIERYRPATGRGTSSCHGTFTPDDGGPTIEVEIEARHCEEGQRSRARLDDTLTLQSWIRQPRAWTPGMHTGDYGALVAGAVLWNSMGFMAAIMLITRRIRSRKGARRPAGPAQPPSPPDPPVEGPTPRPPGFIEPLPSVFTIDR
ncbi:hypothetical protein [Glycomyces buryatensis]|uniref:Uncharacterized protein n=1 Tax=Glycomyces buryatensis TaxID=2570927 RepID=A0A4S8QD82_9ACTN|nr:hypothetical protein [Glycomyces buryatensis]THV42260.1 hypothetical protein FAB82_07215 [Glycomyces buryatensis]